MKRLIRAYIIIIICLLAGSATASVSPQHFTKDEILFISSAEFNLQMQQNSD